MKKSLIIVVILFISRSAFAERDSIAVFQFDNLTRSKNYEFLSNSIPDLVVSAIADLKRFQVIRRTNIENLIRRQNIAVTQVNHQASTLSKQLKADIFIVGSFTVVKDRLLITGNIYSTNGEKLLAGGSEQGNIDTSIFDTMDRFVKKLSDNLDKAIPKKEVVVQFKDKLVYRDAPVTKTENRYFSGRFGPTGEHFDYFAVFLQYEKAFAKKFSYLFSFGYLGGFWFTGDIDNEFHAQQAFLAGVGIKYYPFATSRLQGLSLTAHLNLGYQRSKGQQYTIDEALGVLQSFDQLDRDGFAFMTLMPIAYRFFLSDSVFTELFVGVGLYNANIRSEYGVFGDEIILQWGPIFTAGISWGVRF